VLAGPRLLEMRQFLRGLVLAPEIRDFALQLVVGTHAENEHASPLVKQFVRCGASPRGAQSIVLAAKVRALLAGRYHVAMDDIAAVALPALRHRLLLNFEGEAEGISTDKIIADLLATVRERQPAGVNLA
jgi:MoxR-like ATPase